MNGNGTNTNVNQVLKAFQRFLISYENPLWAKNANVEDIKSIFKLGNFIESSICTFKTKELLINFLLLLEVWGKQNNVKTYDEDFLILANDQLLRKLFRSPNVKETILDIAVRVYTSLYPKERFKECIKKLILDSSSLKAIANFVNTFTSDKNVIENEIILSKWSNYCELGLQDTLKSEIESYLSLYNVEEKLPRLIGILGLRNTVPNQENVVKSIILECILNKMSDRSLLSKTFWLSLFKKINGQHISQASKNYPAFLESLLNFIEYIGGMMIREDSNGFDKWISDPSISFCHEITHTELVIFLKVLCSENEIKKLVLGRLDQAKKYSNAELWSEIIDENFSVTVLVHIFSVM